MVRAHFVKKARKTYRGTGIKKGTSYWWWKFRRGVLQRSKTQPRPSQLTQSAFWGSYLSSTEGFDASVAEATTGDDLRAAVSTLTEVLEELKTETEEKYDNMPEPLQQGDTGELLQERIDGLGEFISELEGVEINDEEESDDEEESEEETTNPFEASREGLQGLSGYTGS
jgi:hypothetical protein